MADVLSVIADVLNQDKRQKKEQAKIMREVQKKLKEKGSEEVAEEPGDKEDYMKFFAGQLVWLGDDYYLINPVHQFHLVFEVRRNRPHHADNCSLGSRVDLSPQSSVFDPYSNTIQVWLCGAWRHYNNHFRNHLWSVDLFVFRSVFVGTGTDLKRNTPPPSEPAAWLRHNQHRAY